MEFVKSLSMFHVDAKEIPCLTEKGAPTEKTEGAVGALYMDTDTGTLYKCTAADSVNKVYTWEPVLDENGSSGNFREADPTVFDWAKRELFKKTDLPLNTQSFVTVDGVEYYRYHAGATNFTWTNPRPQPGPVTITARGVSQYGGTGSTRLKTVYDDGTSGPELWIVVSGDSRTVTVTTDAAKTLARITGNYDMENWVLLDMSVMSVRAEYDGAPQNDYQLPVASAETLGGVKPVAKTDDMAQSVGVDENGGLWTAPSVGVDKWDVHYKVNIPELLENGFEITEVDGKPLQLKEMYAMVKLQSAVDSAWLGCRVTTDSPNIFLSTNSSGSGGVNANTGEYAYFVYHAVVLPDSSRAVCEIMCNKNAARGAAIMMANEPWLNNWIEYNPVNYITGLKCANNLGAGTSQGYGTEIEIWGKSK